MERTPRPEAELSKETESQGAAKPCISKVQDRPCSSRPAGAGLTEQKSPYLPQKTLTLVGQQMWSPQLTGDPLPFSLGSAPVGS